MSADPAVTVWDPARGDWIFPAVVYGAVFAMVVLLLDLPGPARVGALVAGLAVDVAVARRLWAPIRYRLSGDVIEVQTRRRTERMPLAELRSITRTYSAAGIEEIRIETPIGAWEMNLGPDTEAWLTKVGGRLAELDLDRRIVPEGRARVLLGLEPRGPKPAVSNPEDWVWPVRVFMTARARLRGR